MKKSIFLFVIGYFVHHACFAQQPDEKLNSWAVKNPIEKLYLHCDRENYVAGQTLWFKAYLYAEFLPYDKSTTLFVELLNEESVMLARKTFPFVIAISRGQLELPDTLSDGKYIVRAYTATMLNQDADFVYKKIISVKGKENKKAKAIPAKEKKLRMEFFPEGGNFVANQPNTIAFKITDENGWPVNAAGVLKNSKGETVSEFDSYHDGMGMIDLTAAEKETYYGTLKDDPSGQKYYLPEPATKGIVFRLMTGNDGIHFEVLQQKNDPIFSAAYMIGQMQHNVVFKQPLKEGAASLSGVIKTTNLSSGILHITVFNKQGLPLAERLSFINNKEYILPARLIADTLNFSDRGRNHLTLAFEDTVIGNFSVAVTDPSFNATAEREENIFSSILLTSDLKGHIHNPAYYFSSETDSAKYALDLVMMTNGWRRFKWSRLLQDSLTAGKYKDPGYITLAGQVTLEGTRKPFAEKDIMLFIVAADSSRNVQMIKTDANGYYRADSVIFFGKASILLSDIRGRKSRFVDIRPSADSLNRPYFLPPVDRSVLVTGSKANDELAKKLAVEYNAFVKAHGIVLSEIVVRSRKKTPLEELEDKYTSGAFSGDSRRTFDLMNTDDATAYTNIFDFLQARVPGLVAGRNDEGDYYVYFRQMATISSLGNQGMAIFLDEVPTDASAIAFIPTNQIALVKVYSTFVGATGGGAGGALAIYMKKGADYFNSLPSAGEIITYNGYTVIKEFYSPDYAAPVKDRTTPDLRTTLHWKPDILVSNVNPKIPVVFYNNDRTRSFKVVVEGMTMDGKMLMLEKTITGKAF